MRGSSIFRPSILRRAINLRSLSSSSSSSSPSPLAASFLKAVPISEKESCSPPQKPPQKSPPKTDDPNDPFAGYPSHFRPSLPGLDEPEEVPPPTNVIHVKLDEDFEAALKRAETESVPSIFYFTAQWCPPCRLVGPVMDELARRYPHINTYKLDIDEKGLANTLEKLNITAVPTMHFFIEGKKVDEVVGGDLVRVVQTIKKHFEKKDETVEKNGN